MKLCGQVYANSKLRTNPANLTAERNPAPKAICFNTNTQSFGARIKTSIGKFFLINDTPHKIAAGFALGVFLGIIPGEGVTATIVLASLFGFNRLAATSGVLATNMWSTFVVLPLAGQIGAWIFRENYQSLIEQFNATYHLGFKFLFSKYIFFEIALPMAIGFIVVALAISLSSYLIIWFLMKSRKMPIHKIS
jgi:uncharacterized protein (DUF2062 family)